ncbi:unnamed protein product [Haemonchus placei]|uniref:Arrestin_N domain-containing protein n=1 Tax=Haemonchus placei TaxID=6290 RepID=A0A0N4W2L0_HAEPC|nr:unnamed protein product [Haemonchus placei]
MVSPTLEKTNVLVKNDSGDQMNVYGKLSCKIEMKGIKTEGYAYVARSGLTHAYDDKEVKLAPKSDVEEPLRNSYPGVFEEGLGRCTKEEVTLQLIPNVRPVFCPVTAPSRSFGSSEC